MSNFSCPSAQLNDIDVMPSDPTLLGQRLLFQHGEPVDGSVMEAMISAMLIEAWLCRNEDTTAILPGKAVVWDVGTTYGPGKAVVDYAGDDVSPAGFVPHNVISTGVPPGSTFFLIRKGPCKGRYDGSANLAIGDPLCTATTGRLREMVFGTDDADSFCGRKMIADKASGTADDLIEIYADCRF
jgi:hypothetical protein